MATAVEPSITCDPAPAGSDRSFGIVFTVVFVIVGCWPLIHFEAPRWWALVIALAFLAIALIRPQLLRPLNKAWLAFGNLLHRIISPLVMGAIFFLCVTPIALILRLHGKDVLSLKRRSDLKSYWISLPPSRPASETMKRQY